MSNIILHEYHIPVPGIRRRIIYQSVYNPLAQVKTTRR